MLHLQAQLINMLVSLLGRVASRTGAFSSGSFLMVLRNTPSFESLAPDAPESSRLHYKLPSLMLTIIVMSVMVKAEEFVGGSIPVVTVHPTEKIPKKGVPEDKILTTYQCPLLSEPPP